MNVELVALVSAMVVHVFVIAHIVDNYDARHHRSMVRERDATAAKEKAWHACVDMIVMSLVALILNDILSSPPHNALPALPSRYFKGTAPS